LELYTPLDCFLNLVNSIRQRERVSRVGEKESKDIGGEKTPDVKMLADSQRK